MEVRPELLERDASWREFELRLAPGPLSLGATYNRYDDLFGHPWGLVKQGNQLTLFSLNAGTSEAINIPHPVSEVRHIALAFDQAAQPVVAYEYQGQIYVRQWDPIAQAFVMRGPWPGCDPVLINDATVGYYIPDSDVLLFHLSPDRRTLIMRVQRELYATARDIQTFEQPVVLDQSAAIPYQIQLLGSLDGALGQTGFVLLSELYPLRPTHETTVLAEPQDPRFILAAIRYELVDRTHLSPEPLAPFYAPGAFYAITHAINLLPTPNNPFYAPASMSYDFSVSPTPLDPIYQIVLWHQQSYVVSVSPTPLDPTYQIAAARYEQSYAVSISPTPLDPTYWL